ncbi:MAG TPA: DUF2530 domain-containing protein [Streptosporangiaceae bacterium]
MKLSRGEAERKAPPPPLEANDQLVAGVVTAAWAIALVVLLIVRDSLPASARWWIWTCLTGVALGLFALWYLPRFKRSRAKAARARDQSAPRDSGSNTVSSTETPGKSTRS